MVICLAINSRFSTAIIALQNFSFLYFSESYLGFGIINSYYFSCWHLIPNPNPMIAAPTCLHFTCFKMFHRKINIKIREICKVPCFTIRWKGWYGTQLEPRCQVPDEELEDMRMIGRQTQDILDKHSKHLPYPSYLIDEKSQYLITQFQCFVQGLFCLLFV